MNNSYCLSCHSGLNRQLSELMQWLCRGRSTALLKNLSVAVLSVISTLHASSLKNPFCLHPPEDIPAEYRECYPHAVPAGSAARGTSIHKMLLFILWRCSSYWQKVPFTLVLYTTAQFQQKQLPKEQLCKSKDMREMSQHVGVIWYRRKLLSILSRKSPMLLTLLN